MNNQKGSGGIAALRARFLQQIKAGVNYVHLIKKEFIAADLPLKITFICVVLVLLAIIIL